jgi:hypothetical protein
MFTTIQFVPGAVNANTNINLPAWARKIDEVVSAFIIRPTSQISISTTALQGADLAATQADHATAERHTLSGGNPVVAATPTRVDEDTITLDVNTVLGDILTLTYVAVGSRQKVA